MRRTLSTKDRARIFAAASGRCHLCSLKIEAIDAWEVEHVIPLAMGGEDEDENRRPAHVRCHRKKTTDDVARIAKAKRQEARFRGFKQPRGTMPGSRRSPWKKKVSGEIVRRP